MTLSELAALAAEKAPRFERPDGPRCATCDAQGGYFDDSPAALLMAVMEFAYRTGSEVRTDYSAFGIQVQAKSGYPQWLTGVWEFDPKLANQEAIARAALVALLRAHGVDVVDG